MTNRNIKTQASYNKFKNKLIKRIDKYIKTETPYIAEKATLELQVNPASGNTAIDELHEMHHAIGNKLMNYLVEIKFKNEISKLEKLSKGITE
ncbi:MAG: hypothetical protein GY756_16525 [bacterium]|nr:hypothetical protein [bacterium]